MSANIRALIVDDEPLAREGLRNHLAEEAGLEIVGESIDGPTAVQAIEKLRPDLVFLDVQMPHLNGFDVLEALDAEAMPMVIFITAYDEHAIKAFEVNALDYLLKPFKKSRFQTAMNRAREQFASRSTNKTDPRIESLLESLRAGKRGSPRILVKSPNQILFLKAEEIDYVESAGNYTVLHSGKDSHIVRDTMSAMESRLSPEGFMRISRSIIVNMNRIAQLQPLVSAGEFCVILKTGARLDMTCSLSELQQKMATI